MSEFIEFWLKQDLIEKIFLIIIPLAMLGVALFILFIIYACIDGWIYNKRDRKKSKIVSMSGTLIDKKYIGEQSSTGMGMAIVPGSGAGIGLVSTSSHSDEEFLFFINADEVYKKQVGMQTYYQVAIGEKVDFDLTIGGLSKKVLDINLKQQL